MDKERLGRILGAGARQAARTAYQAVDAAMAPDPKQKQQPRATPSAMQDSAPQNPTQPSRNVATAAPDAIATALRTAQAINEGKKRMKQSAMAPIKRAGRSLALEIFGSFFLLFSGSFLIGAWKVRTGFSQPGTERNHLFTFLFFAALFGYFGISSFVRARKK